MKTIFKNTLIVMVLICTTTISKAQYKDSLISLFQGSINPYEIEVTYHKTTHLIFPSGVRYVDLGSDFLIADKAADAENVLRIKASQIDFEPETNFSVITEDGRFYNFNVRYSLQPLVMNYDLEKMKKSTSRQNHRDVLFKELGNTDPSLAKLLMEAIHKKNKRIIKHIASKSFGINFMLKGIYIHDGKFYFHTELQNDSALPFNIDFINFKVVDKKTAKRTVVQEKSLMPLRIYEPLLKIESYKINQNVYLLNQFTLSDDKVLVIEIYERNGSRHQVLRIENSDLVNAKPVDELVVKYH